MKVTLLNDETQNKKVQLSKNFWTGKMNIVIDDQELKKVKRNKYTYMDENGESYNVLVSGNEITGMSLEMNERKISVLRKLTVFEIIISILPGYLIFLGGALGGVLGVIGMIVISYLCRQTNNLFMKVVYSFSATMIATAIWYVLASMILNIL